MIGSWFSGLAPRTEKGREICAVHDAVAGQIELGQILPPRTEKLRQIRPVNDTVLVEVPNPNHPYGVRGVGEVPIIPPMAAVANAVSDAIGVRLKNLPMSPPKVLASLKNGGNGAAS